MAGLKLIAGIVAVLVLSVSLAGCIDSSSAIGGSGEAGDGTDKSEDKYEPPVLEEMQQSSDFSVRLPAYVPSGYSSGDVTIEEDSSITTRFGNDDTMGIIEFEEWHKDSDWLDGYEGEQFEINGGIAKFVSDGHLAGYLNETKLGFALISRTTANSAKISKDELVKMADSMTCGNNAADALETSNNCCIDVGCGKNLKCTNNECISG